MSGLEKTQYNLKDAPKGIGSTEEVIKVPEKLAVFTDKKTGVKTVAFPFAYKSGVNGIISLTHLSTLAWQPGAEIDEIIIKFK